LFNRDFWSCIRWWILGPCLGAVVVGLVFLVFPIDEGTKFFISGALIGIGAGGAIAELSAAFERIEAREEMRQLREPGYAQCRLAFRMGEFSVPFAFAISKGQNDDREVKQVLFLAEVLGVQSTVEAAIRDANLEDPKLVGTLVRRLEEATIYVGEHLLTFFKLGSDIVAMRAPGITTKLDDDVRAVLVKRVAENLNRTKGFTAGSNVAKSWAHFSALWNRNALTVGEIYDLLISFYGFFVALGLDSEGFLPFKAIVDDLANLHVGKTGRPAGLAQIFGAISATGFSDFDIGRQDNP
jgi:hypothetical protein